MEAIRAHFEREAASDAAWTSYNASLARPLLNSEKFLVKKPEAAAAESNSTPVASPPEENLFSGKESPPVETTSVTAPAGPRPDKP
jgi:hypothetical protein